MRSMATNVCCMDTFGQGVCTHRFDFDLLTREGLNKSRAFIDEAADLVLSRVDRSQESMATANRAPSFARKCFGPQLMRAFGKNLRPYGTRKTK